MTTTYKVKGRDVGLEFLFKYDLNGFLTEFKKNQPLTEEQRLWLYSARFPETEELMKQWIAQLKKKFEVVKVPADLSFDTLWELYGHKHSKVDAIKSFKKLKEPDVIKVFQSLKKYDEYLARTRIGKAHLSTYINKRRFEDEY